MEAVGSGELEGAKWKQSILCDWLGEHIWLSLVGPELEVRLENGGRGQTRGKLQSWSQSNPDCLEPTAIEVAVWLPGLVAAEVVGHIFIYGLAVVPFVYSISQRYLAQAYYSWKGCHSPPSLLCTTFPKSLQPGFSPCGHCRVPRHPGQTPGSFLSLVPPAQLTSHHPSHLSSIF